MIRGGGACLVALERERGRQLRSRTGQQQRRSRSLPKRRGGRNNEYHVNRCISMHDMTSDDARRALMWYEVMPVKGGNIRENIPGVSCFWAAEPEGESCVFWYVRGVWWTNGLRIRVRLVVLSNFHVESIFIRVTDYFILIFKVLDHFLNYF